MKHVISLVSHQFIFTPSKDFFVSMTHYSVWREIRKQHVVTCPVEKHNTISADGERWKQLWSNKYLHDHRATRQKTQRG